MGNDGDGSLSHPYSSLQQALDHIENEYYHDINSVRRTTINLYPTHHFVDTIHFTQARNHTHLTTMSGNTYSAVISQAIFVNQLFVDNRRIPRTRVLLNYSDYLQYAAPFEDPDQAQYGF